MKRCKFLSKSLNGSLRCRFKKQHISLLDCENCLEFVYVENKGIKKVSDKRIFVKRDTFEKVLERDRYICRLEDATCEGKIELHHIRYRSERKDLINEPSNCIMLCTKHHKQVHSNKHYWQPILLEMVKENK